MPGINTTGIPSTNDYLIGRGKLQLAFLGANDRPLSFRDVGNVPEAALTFDSEIYEHFSSREGLKKLDKSVVIQQTGNISFVLENVLDFGNLAYFMSGEAKSYTNPAVAGYAGATLVPAGSIVANAWYNIVDASGNPLFAIDSAKLTVETTNATPVTLVLNTDYTVDTFTGQIFLNDTAAVQTAISGNEGLTTDYAADASAGSVDVLEGQTKTAVTVAGRFISTDAATGNQIIIDIHKMTISSDGDFNLISDEVTQAPMTGGIEKSDYYTDTVSVYAPGARSV